MANVTKSQFFSDHLSFKKRKNLFGLILFLFDYFLVNLLQDAIQV